MTTTPSMREALEAFSAALSLPDGPSLAVQRHDPSWQAWKRLCDCAVPAPQHSEEEIARVIDPDEFTGEEEDDHYRINIGDPRRNIARQKARAILSRLSRPDGDWRTIESAPKDGSIIDLEIDGTIHIGYWGLAPNAVKGTKRHPWVVLDPCNGVNQWLADAPQRWRPSRSLIHSATASPIDPETVLACAKEAQTVADKYEIERMELAHKPGESVARAKSDCADEIENAIRSLLPDHASAKVG